MDRRREAQFPAFTLIELLVVVAIIAMLISILLPSMRSARDIAKEVVCNTRLNELYRANLYYAQANDNCFPHYNRWLYQQVSNEPSKKWVEYGSLFRYVINREVYFCPCDDKTRRRNSWSIGSGGQYGNEAIHSYVRQADVHYDYRTSDSQYDKIRDYLRPELIISGSWYPYVPQNLIRDGQPVANKVVLMYEEAQGIEEASTACLNDGYSFIGNSLDPLTARHRGRGATLFWDGHMEFFKATTFNSNALLARALSYGVPRAPI